MKAFFAVLLAFFVLFLLLGVAARELFLALKSTGRSIRGLPFFLVYALVVTGALAAFVASYAWRSMPHGAAVFAQFAMGYLIVFVLVMDLLSLGLCAARVLRGMHAVTGTSRLTAGLVAFAFTLGLFFYGAHHALDVQTKEYKITLDKEFAPVRCALISDLHLGRITDAARLSKIKEKIDALSPDILLIAGDIFDSDISYIKDQDAALQALSGFSAPLGVWACLGNHDAGETLPQMLAFLEKAGVNVLCDESHTIASRLVVAGRRDSRPIAASEERLPLSLDASPLPVIVLDHQPQNYTEYSSDVDLVLCGHTHRGQFFPGNLITRALYDVDYGLFQKDAVSPRVLVTSGVGFWGPVLRIGTDSEVVLIELQGK